MDGQHVGRRIAPDVPSSAAIPTRPAPVQACPCGARSGARPAAPESPQPLPPAERLGNTSASPEPGPPPAPARIAAPALPADLLPAILRHLPPLDLARVACVARAWRGAAQAPELWQPHLERRGVPERPGVPGDWPATYGAWTACLRYPLVLERELLPPSHSRELEHLRVGADFWATAEDDCRAVGIFNDMGARLARFPFAAAVRFVEVAGDTVAVATQAGELRLCLRDGTSRQLRVGDGRLPYALAIDAQQVACTFAWAPPIPTSYGLEVFGRTDGVPAFAASLRGPPNRVGFLDGQRLAVSWLKTSPANLEILRRDCSELLRSLRLSEFSTLDDGLGLAIGPGLLWSGRLSAEGTFRALSLAPGVGPDSLAEVSFEQPRGRACLLGDAVLYDRRPHHLAVRRLTDGALLTEARCIREGSEQNFVYVIGAYEHRVITESYKVFGRPCDTDRFTVSRTQFWRFTRNSAGVALSEDP